MRLSTFFDCSIRTAPKRSNSCGSPVASLPNTSEYFFAPLSAVNDFSRNGLPPSINGTIYIERRAHASPHRLGVEWIDGRTYDSQIGAVECRHVAHDGAEIAGIRRVDEYDVVSVSAYLRVEFSEFGDGETVLFGT